MVIGIGLNLWPGRAGEPPEPVPAVAQPSITSPVDDAVDVSLTPTLTSSAFSVTNEGSDTHASSDWQVAEDAGFATIAAESLDDATNKVSWTVPSALANETEYFARVRHTGTTLGDGPWSPPVSFTTAAASAFDSDAQAFFDACDTEPSAGAKTAINDLVVGLKADDIWDHLGAFYPMCMEDSQAGRLNLKAPGTYTLTAVNSPTFTAKFGWAGNGSTSYLDVGANATELGMLQNDASFGCWIDGGTSGSSNAVAMGATNSATGNGCYLRPNSSSILRGAINADAGTQASYGSVGTSYGFSVLERTAASGSTGTRGYRNGASNGTASSASGTRAATDFAIGGNKNGGTFESASDYRISCAFFGPSLGTTKQSDFYDRLVTFRAAMAAL